MFLGYSITQSAYFCLDRSTSRIYTSRHVVFHEHVFPFSLPAPIETTNDDESNTSTYPTVKLVSPINNISGLVTPPSDQSSRNIPATEDPTPSVTPTVTTAPSTTMETELPPVPEVQQPQPQPAPPPTRQSTRQRKPVQKLNLHTKVVQTMETPPTTVAQALKSPHWRKAMSDEYEAQIGNHSWDLENLPDDTCFNVVGCKWIFTIKRNPDGTIARYKARPVAKGFTQKPGIDYHDTFSPVVKPATIRIVLSTAVSSNWPIRQLDVNNAFLQGTLKDEVYKAQPPGFISKDNPNAVCRFRKAIYGLKQAPRAWYNELKQFLLQAGFINSLADASLFIYRKQGVLLYMLVYVDDLILTGNSSSHLTKFIDSLSQRFSLKDLDDLSFFLGIEVQRTAKGMN